MTVRLRCSPRVVAPLATCVLVLLLAACRGQQTQLSPDQPYEPAYRSRPGDAAETRGTLRGDFQWAAMATTLGEAAVRWEDVLRTHNPPGQEFEDSLHASYVKAAQHELLRVYYLVGRRDEADELLRRLDPPGWDR